MPAQSPTLSPTLSAITAGLRGSSSGMPASTLPTRSAPTSAALVKMPPPTRMNSASSVPPKPKPSRASGAALPRIMKMIVPPNRPRPSASMPVSVPAPEAQRKAAPVAVGSAQDVATQRRGVAQPDNGDGQYRIDGVLFERAQVLHALLQLWMRY